MPIASNKLNRLNLSLFLILLNVILLITFLPTAPGFAYAPHHYANLFLPNFGLNSEFSTLPYAAKSLLASYSFKRILILVVNNNIVRLNQLMYALSKVLTISAYFLILNDITKDKSISAILCLSLGLLINWPGIPLSLIVVFIYSLLHINDQKRYLTGMLSYATLSLYWHSAGMVGLSIFVGYLVISILFKFLRKYSNTTGFLVTPILITTFSWVFIRGLDYGMALHNVLTMLQTFSIESLKMGLFSKGAFIPTKYVFKSNFPISLNIINRMRYIAYLIIYIFSALIFINIIKKKRVSKFDMLFLMALIGDILFKILYFGATKSVSPIVTTILLYPMTVLYLISKINCNKSVNIQKRILLYILLAFLLTSFLLSTLQSNFTETFEDTQGTTHFKIYMPSILWISQHASNNINIITDGNTGGYYQIIYVKQKLYNHSKIRIFKNGITYKLYEKIYTGSYKNNKYSILVVNLEIIKKHLRLVSLEAWNRFEPIPLERIVNNNLSVIYNDNRFMILK